MDKTQLIFKVLSKEATAEEVNELEVWINSDRTNKIDYEDLKLLWEGTQSGREDNSEDQKYGGFQSIRLAIKQRQRKRKMIYVLCVVIFLVILIFVVNLFVLERKKANYSNVSIKFEHSTLSRVASTFKERYRIQLHIPPHLQTCEFTGMVYQQSPKDALIYIAAGLNLEYSIIDEHNFSLNGRACKQKPI
jgi:hypothetical protein